MEQISLPPYTTVDKAVKAAMKIAHREQPPRLIAISKQQSSDKIRPFLDLRHRHFGENKVQEAIQKWPSLREEYPDIILHFVGQLQSNKAAEAIRYFDRIHSVDRMRLIDALAKEMDKQNRYIPLLLQANLDEEEQKGGCSVHAVADLLKYAIEKGLTVDGLMIIPPRRVNPAPYFALLAKIGKEHGLRHLSMGMSGDFEMATKMGATFLRVGTALFGERG